MRLLLARIKNSKHDLVTSHGRVDEACNELSSARVTTASMTEHAVACLVEEHAVWTKRGLEQGKGEVNRIEKGVFVNMFACIAGSVSHYKGCPFCVVYRLIFTFTGKIYFQHAARADFSRSYLYRCSSPLKHT